MPVLLEFGLALLAIVVAAAIFTNAVEILGGRLNLGDGAVGSVLAAVGTALPETMIPIVAVLAAVFAGRNPDIATEIGIGAILGRHSCSRRSRCSLWGSPRWRSASAGRRGWRYAAGRRTRRISLGARPGEEREH